MATPPVIHEFTVTPPTAAPGAALTATVVRTSGTADQSDAWTGSLTDQEGDTEQVSETFTKQVPDPAQVVVTDSAGGSWAVSSDDGTRAVLTGAAPQQVGPLTVTATVTGPASGLSAIGQTSVAVMIPALFGASLGPVKESDPSIGAWAAAVGVPLAVRHVFEMSTVPASPAWLAEAGVRRILADFDLAKDGSQAQAFSAALGAYKAAGLNLDVTLWHAAPSKGFASPADLFAALPPYVAALREHGYRYVFDLNSWQAIHQNLWQSWFPTDPAIKPGACGLEYYIQGFLGGQRLEACAAFAHQQGVPFGLCELGADASKYTEAQGIKFLTYALDFTRSQAAAGYPEGIYDVILWNDVVGNTAPGFPVTAQPASWISLYQQIAAVLASA